MIGTGKTTTSSADILSPEAYPWLNFVEAYRRDGTDDVNCLFYSPQNRGTVEQTLATYPALLRSTTPVEPYTEFLTPEEAQVVAKWLEGQEWFEEVQIVTLKPGGALPKEHYPIERAIGALDKTERRHVLLEKDGWAGFPLHVVTTRRPVDQSQAGQGTREEIEIAFKELLEAGEIEIVPGSEASGKPRYRTKER